MLFFLDENFPVLATEFLRERGHDSVRALQFFPQGAPDELLFDKAQALGAAFLSTDKDFFHTVPFIRSERTAAVIAFTLAQPTRTRIIQRLGDFLSVVPDPKAGEVYLVTDSRILKR